MDDLLCALGLPLWLTSSPSAPEASVLSQLAQSDRHVDGSSWHHGAMVSASVVIGVPIDAAILQVCPDMTAPVDHLWTLAQRPVMTVDQAEAML
jgi:hypothetical protein